MIIILFIVLWIDKNRRKTTETTIVSKNNCKLKVDIEGVDVKEWVVFTFNINGVDYKTIPVFISTKLSLLVNNDNSINRNLLFDKYVWKDGKHIYLPYILDENSDVSVKMKFIHSEFYKESRVKSYTVRVIKCVKSIINP